MVNEQKFITNSSTMFTTRENLKQFINTIEGEVFIPQKCARGTSASGGKDIYFMWSTLKQVQGKQGDFSLDGFRATLSPKFFFYNPQEVLKEKEIKPRTIIGIKACDLKGIMFLKKVFKEGVLDDPFLRDDILIISSDCTESCESCFCALLGDTPYPDKNFDINLSEIEDGYAVAIENLHSSSLNKIRAHSSISSFLISM